MRFLVIGMAMLCAAFQTAGADLSAGNPAYQTLTNLSQLQHSTNTPFPSRVLWPARIEGTVLLGSSIQTILALDGSDQPLAMPMKPQARPLQRGQRVLLEGNCVSDGAVLHLESTPVVNNDGVHSAFEQTGAAFLKAGKHPVRLVYFDRGGDHTLQVYMNKFGSKRRQISDRDLFHPRVDLSTGETNWEHGLMCRSFKGNWETLPDFGKLKPVQSGIVSNFNLGMLIATNGGLEFSGCVEVPENGLYQFSTTSDDGSDLFVDDFPLSVHVLKTRQMPPLPRFAAGQILPRGLETQCAEVEGVVTFTGEEQSCLILELTSGSGRTKVRVLDSSGIALSLLPGSRLRAAGLCQSTYTPEGNRVAGSLVVPTGRELVLLDVPHKLWEAHPIQPISQIRDAERSNSVPGLLHVWGTLSASKQDSLWRVEDETGALLIGSAQLHNELSGLSGQQVEVLGRLSRAGTNDLIEGCVLRQMAPGNGKNRQLPLLTTVEEVKQLSRDEAQRGYPVRVRGVITFSWGLEGFFLQDGTWSIDVRMTKGLLHSQPRIGDYWEIDGVTFAEFAPDVLATRAVRIGQGTMPEPIHPTLDQLVNGSLDTLYIEVQGVVSSASSNTLALLTRGGDIKVQVMDLDANLLKGHQGALIRLRGCLVPERDFNQHAKFGEFSLRNASLTVDAPAPADPFAFPRQRISDLLLFDSHSSVIRRTKLVGQFLQQSAGECFLTDGESGLRIFPQEPLNLQRGDWVEVVGFPGLGAASPILREAVVRRTGNGPLPPARLLSATNLLDGRLDATLVKMEARLVDWRQNSEEQVLELQIGPRTFLARLPASRGFKNRLPLGSRLLLTGVYVAQGGDRAAGREIDSFQLLLDSAKDVLVLQQPSWWTPRRRLVAAGTLLGALLLAAIWIWELRRRVERRTRELKNEIEEHKRTELQLEQQTRLLSQEVDQRKRIEQEVERGHKQLLVVSRLAGMADVATSILHNVGNVLTNVNVLCSSISDRIRNSKVSSVAKLGEMLAQNSADMDQFLTRDERGKKMPVYVQQLGSHLAQEQSLLLEKVKSLNENILHINQIVATQQDYAKNAGVLETVYPGEIVEDALRMHGESLKRHDIKLVRNSVPLSKITLDSHKVLQILVNLLENAKYACLQGVAKEKRVTIDVESGRRPGTIQIRVSDNGMGIPPENLARIFAQGFSTRKDGHGFGLHSSILAAQDMGGDLLVRSDGPGKGACFTLELPLLPPKRSPHP